MTLFLSGLFGGMTSTMGKLFMSVCHYQSGLDFLTTPMAWATGLPVIFSVFSNLANLNSTISLYSQLMVMPTYECCIIIGSLLCGGFVMGELDYYGEKELLMIGLGSSICVSGIMYKVCMLEPENDEEEPSVHNVTSQSHASSSS